VSWNDITAAGSGFLARLQSFSQGVPPELPTEAEWEYACRADARSAYSFGDEITPAQVNYNQNYRDDVGAFWVASGTTVAVKSLPVNPWRLYEMHGNVAEWCSNVAKDDDGMMAESSDDTPAQHALRGGSWFHGAEQARSASHVAAEAAIRSRFLGFRFLLRS